MTDVKRVKPASNCLKTFHYLLIILLSLVDYILNHNESNRILLHGYGNKCPKKELYIVHFNNMVKLNNLDFKIKSMSLSDPIN